MIPKIPNFSLYFLSLLLLLCKCVPIAEIVKWPLHFIFSYVHCGMPKCICLAETMLNSAKNQPHSLMIRHYQFTYACLKVRISQSGSQSVENSTEYIYILM